MKRKYMRVSQGRVESLIYMTNMYVAALAPYGLCGSSLLLYYRLIS